MRILGIIQINTVTVSILFANMHCMGQVYQLGQCVFVNAYSGLNLRIMPSIDGEVIDNITFGTEVEEYTHLVYLHGGPGGAISENTIEMLAPFSDQGYDVYAYDQVGSGSSSRLEDISAYTVDRHKADLEKIIHKIGAQKVIIIGQSWGSVLATFFAIDNPLKIDKLIMTGPGPFPINSEYAELSAPDSLNIKAPTFSNKEGNKTAYTFRYECVRWIASKMAKKLISDEEADDFFTYLNSNLNKSALYVSSKMKESFGGGGYYAHIMTMKSLYRVQSPREKMQILDFPVLLLRGQYDNQK